MTRSKALTPLHAVPVAVVAFFAAGLVGWFTFALGLLVADWLILALGHPLGAILTGVAAALAAAWMANALAPDRSRTRLDAALVGGVGGAFLGLVLLYAVELTGAAPRGIPLVAVILLATIGATWATLTRRRPSSPLRRDAWTSVGLLLLIPIAIYGLIGLACLLDACGA